MLNLTETNKSTERCLRRARRRARRSGRVSDYRGGATAPVLFATITGM
jgi:hypothetical protein